MHASVVNSSQEIIMAANNLTHGIVSVLAGIGATLLPLHVQADMPASAEEGIARIVVRYGDLNLASAEGARALHRRIVNAARRVCGGDSARELRLQREAAQCRKLAIARAVRDVGNAPLAAAHEARRRR
jgi:UrcA family protein